jgi:hypothetical protein
VDEVARVGRDVHQAIGRRLGALGLEALDEVDQEVVGARVVRISDEYAFHCGERVEGAFARLPVVVPVVPG